LEKGVSSDIDRAFECFKGLAESLDIRKTRSEADIRAKVIDPVFKDCLGWDEDDIAREEHIHSGWLDYIFRLGNRPLFVLEAKKDAFIVPLGLKRSKYKISGSAISTDRKIKNAIDQAQKYSTDSGTTFAVVSNGTQFIIFESFTHLGKWNEGYCTIFKSLHHILDNFTYFWNILSKEAVLSGSLRRYISDQDVPLEFTRPLDFVHNENASSGKNILASHLTPIIETIFADLTDDAQIEALKKCYVRQRHLSHANDIIKGSFDRLPHYSDQFDISWFRETETDAGEFQISFEKCREFLATQTPIGSTIILLGGIGAGKTTFIHHFFKVFLGNREDILWFCVDFGKSPPDIDSIEGFVYESIIEHYRRYYRARLDGVLKSSGLDSPEPNSDSILAFFTMMRYNRYTVSIVLDNADQHSYTSPKYQERVFEVAQNLTHKFKTITILTLREESFFRSTRSGVLDAYHVPMFHVESPSFEDITRHRVGYTLGLLRGNKEEIVKITKSPFADWGIAEMFFKVIRNSIRRTRRVGKEILRFINDISGGNMRDALRYINTFMTSGNTDVGEMLDVETKLPPDAPPSARYQIPLHHMIKSIMLSDFRYYTSSHSDIMNLFQVNPQYTNSHFIPLRILDYLYRRMNYFVALEKGFVPIDQIMEDAEIGGISEKAIGDSLGRLSRNLLVEYNNQNRDGFDTAEYVRITATGVYYLEYLVGSFAYLDLVFGDTLISDTETSKKLKQGLRADLIRDKVERMMARFERTEIFLEYLSESEEEEIKRFPSLLYSDLTQTRFMDRILEGYLKEKEYILTKLA